MFQMATTVPNDNDCYSKWQQLLFEMATTVIRMATTVIRNGNDCYSKWQRLFQMATTVIRNDNDCSKWQRLSFEMATTVLNGNDRSNGNDRFTKGKIASAQETEHSVSFSHYD